MKIVSSHRFSEDIRYEILKKNLKRKFELAKWRQKHVFFMLVQI